MINRHGFRRNNLVASGIVFLSNDPLHDEECFRRMLGAEQKRTEQLNKSFMLMLIDVSALLQCKNARKIVQKLLDAICAITRETDIKGWHDANKSIGIIFTEFDENFIDFILSKLKVALHDTLTFEHGSLIHVSYIIFPRNRSANNIIVKLNAA